MTKCCIWLDERTPMRRIRLNSHDIHLFMLFFPGIEGQSLLTKSNGKSSQISFPPKNI